MRKYLQDIGVTNFPETWGSDDKRKKQWKKQRKKYGFDEREIWSLDYAFFLWLYERAKMFLEIAAINLDYHKFDFKGKEYTQRELIELVLKRLEEYFNNNSDYTDTTCEIGEIWAKLLSAMWW